MKDKRDLLGSLAYWVAAGKLEAQSVLPGIQKLSEGEAQSVPDMLEALGGEQDEALAALGEYLRQVLRREALRVYDSRKSKVRVGEPHGWIGLPAQAVEEWKLGLEPTGPVEIAVRASRELAALASDRQKAPRLFSKVREGTLKALAEASAAVVSLIERLPQRLFDQLEQSWPYDMPGRGMVLVELRQRRSASQQRWLEQAGRVLGSLPDPSERDEETLPETLATRFAAVDSRKEKARVLDLACSWMTPGTVSALTWMTQEPWAQDRALWSLTVRFGRPELDTWEKWKRWLEMQERLWQSQQEAFAALVHSQAPGLLLVLYSRMPDPDPAVLDALVKRVAESGESVDISEMLSSWSGSSWSKWVSPEERAALLDGTEPRPPVIVAAGVPEQAPPVAQPPPLPRRMPERAVAQAVPLPPQRAPVTAEPPAPPKPTAWEAHIQPFFVENWYIVAGIAMVILGSSLLAYYTWDKHWLVRYTIMPLLLAGFTWSLARVGDWIEKRSAEFKGTAAILRGAAIGLLPINFMAMALLSADAKVPQKGPALLAMGCIYILVFGWGLLRWCGAVERSLGKVLGGTLLLLNALVALGPLAGTVGRLDDRSLWICVGTGFYLGFAVTAAAIVYFARRILTRELAEEKRVPWFVASVLAVTYLQVFVWVHGFMRHLPQASTYSLLVILTGWLILYAERRALELKATPQLHGGESFLGFGAILLGLLMGFSDPWVRIASFLAAGGVWLYQGLARRHALHHWIALMLLGLAGASVGLLSKYPGPWLPLLGVGLALCYGLGGWAGQRGASQAPASSTAEQEAAKSEMAAPAGTADLAHACRGMQVVALLLTAIVAPLVQWHYASAPLGTAGWLACVAALFAWRAFRDDQVHWLHATMTILALALPYAGFMDVAGRTAHHNTMVFGLALLSWLWLGATWIVRKPLVLRARSGVLWLYGTLALVAMVLRVALGDTAPHSIGYRDWMDCGGPLLMTFALIPATYFSRSLGPAGIAVAIMAILFPELKGTVEQTFPWLAWGTGLGSAMWGLALVGLCFALRPWNFLKDLPEGDRFGGGEMFPFQRRDHTLFTWPIMAAAVFLLVKVDTFHLVRNLAVGAIPFKTAVALGITGVAWTLAAVYHRQDRVAVAGVHLGSLCMLAGISLGYWGQASAPYWTWPALAMGLLLQGLYWFYRFGLEPAWPWVRALLTEPTRMVLLAGSALLAVVCIACLVVGEPWERLRWLYAFLAAQLVWHALRTRNWVWGTILFFQTWTGVLVLTAAGAGPLWERATVETGLSPTLWLLVGIQLLVAGLEFTPKRLGAVGAPVEPALDTPREGDERTAAEVGVTDKASSEACGKAAGPVQGGLYQVVEPIITPAFVLASCVVVLCGLAGLADGVHALRLSGFQQILLLGTLLLTARAQASSLILLPAILLGYLMIHREQLTTLASLDRQLGLLTAPWRVGLLSLCIVLLAEAGRWLHGRVPRLLEGSFALRAFTAPSRVWLFWPAVIFSAVAVLYHTASPALRESGVQLWTPYLATATFALVGMCWRQPGFFAGAGLSLLLGNIHLVRVFGGGYLRGHGLSELHLICLGVGFTLLQTSVLRRAIRSSVAIPAINRASLGLAALILALLSANYFTEPNLEAITSTRFVISGALAWLAGWYFRRAARQPGPGEETHTDLCEALYHYGVVVAFWCAALLIPWFRRPLFALVALGLPVIYFYARAEAGMRLGRTEARRYRNSAAVLGFAVLGLYLFKGIFHLVLFPGVPISTQHYHYNAPFIILLGVVLLRLHGLGGTNWLAFYGGLALITGSYFLLTALPGLSPFDHPMPAAWSALGLGHFWILVSYRRSPLRTIIQRLAGLNDAAWHDLRHGWGLYLLVATHGIVVWGLMDYAANTLMVAPLLAGAASIFVHQGIIRKSPYYLTAAGLELAAALHMDFLIPSYLPRENIIWVMLGMWVALLAAFEPLRSKLPRKVVGNIATVLGLSVVAHVLYHRPWSPVGLWGMGIAAVLTAWTPVERTATAWDRFLGALLLVAPVWLVYFSQAPFEARGVEAALEPWAVLASTGMFLLIGLFSRWFPAYWAARYHARARTDYRLFDVTLGWLETEGPAIQQAVLWLTTGIVGAVQVLHYQQAFTPREFALLVLLEAALAIAWFFVGRERQSMLPNFLMQLCAAACFASIRRHLMLTTGWWTYEYDVWASLACSFSLAGTRQALTAEPRSLRVPLVTTLCVMPVLALIWVTVHGLGVNLALVVVGLHSVLFAYLGKDNRESPYNIVALAGFVGFILLTFYSKLHLRAVNAYIIPVGLGVLVLQELFRKRIQPGAQNGIRLLTLMAMLGSSAYYALADTSHAITFNLTMIILCLLAMGLGSAMRIRLYLALGFAGLMVDLLSLLYKVLVLMERSARMTVVGSLVLVIGAALVFGAIYYKTNKARIDGLIDQWRFKLAQWQ